MQQTTSSIVQRRNLSHGKTALRSVGRTEKRLCYYHLKGYFDFFFVSEKKGNTVVGEMSCGYNIGSFRSFVSSPKDSQGDPRRNCLGQQTQSDTLRHHSAENKRFVHSGTA